MLEGIEDEDMPEQQENTEDDEDDDDDEDDMNLDDEMYNEPMVSILSFTQPIKSLCFEFVQ